MESYKVICKGTPNVQVEFKLENGEFVRLAGKTVKQCEQKINETIQDYTITYVNVI